MRNKSKRSGWFIHSVITTAGHSITTAKSQEGKLEQDTIQNSYNFQQASRHFVAASCLESGNEPIWKICLIVIKVQYRNTKPLFQNQSQRPVTYSRPIPNSFTDFKDRKQA